MLEVNSKHGATRELFVLPIASSSTEQLIYLKSEKCYTTARCTQRCNGTGIHTSIAMTPNPTLGGSSRCERICAKVTRGFGRLIAWAYLYRRRRGGKCFARERVVVAPTACSHISNVEAIIQEILPYLNVEKQRSKPHRMSGRRRGKPKKKAHIETVKDVRGFQTSVEPSIFLHKSHSAYISFRQYVKSWSTTVPRT